MSKLIVISTAKAKVYFKNDGTITQKVLHINTEENKKDLKNFWEELVTESASKRTKEQDVILITDLTQEQMPYNIRILIDVFITS